MESEKLFKLKLLLLSDELEKYEIKGFFIKLFSFVDLIKNFLVLDFLVCGFHL